MSSDTVPSSDDDAASGMGRRQFLAFLVAAPTLAVAVNSRLLGGTAHALTGTVEPADLQDLGDI